MEIKSQRETERELILKMIDTVNSQKEWEWWTAELARLDTLAGAPVHIAPETRRVLTLAGVEIIETEGGTILRGIDAQGDAFELTCDFGVGLIQCARTFQTTVLEFWPIPICRGDRQ